MPAFEASSGSETDFRASIGHERLRELYNHWTRLRGDRRCPLRSEFDPFAIPRLLPNILLNEVEPGGRFRIRLEGSSVSAARGWNATGRYLDDPGVVTLQDDVVAAYQRMLTDFTPVYREGGYPLSDGRPGRLYRLALPLSRDGSAVDFILVGFYHELRSASRP